METRRVTQTINQHKQQGLRARPAATPTTLHHPPVMQQNKAGNKVIGVRIKVDNKVKAQTASGAKEGAGRSPLP